VSDERLEPAVARARDLVDGRGVPGIALAACEAVERAART
jgi:hypothetical protein